MSALVLQPFQQAIYSILAADSTLATLVTGIYDQVEPGVALPYLVFGTCEMVDVPVRGNTVRLRQVMEIHTQDMGRKTMQAIASRVHFLLHEASLTLAYGTVSKLRVTRLQMRRQGVTGYRGEMEISAVARV